MNYNYVNDVMLTINKEIIFIKSISTKNYYYNKIFLKRVKHIINITRLKVLRKHFQTSQIL